MELDWMGRYLPLILAISEHGAVVNSEEKNRKKDFGDGIRLSIQEWKILVCVIDSREDNIKMNMMAAQLRIPQSTFSKMTKNLCGYGLVEKVQANGNKKNVILRHTESGLEFYHNHSQSIRSGMFSRFFDALKDVSDEDIERVTRALRFLNEDMCPELTGRDSNGQKTGKPKG